MPRDIKRSPLEIAHDRAFAAQMHLKGASSAHIAMQLTQKTNRTISEQMVKNDILALTREWQREAAVAIDTAIALELQKLSLLERIYWERFERSMQPRENTSSAITDIELLAGDGAGTRIPGQRKHTQIERIESVGDPRWLRGLHWCYERRSKILGLDQPDKIQLLTDAPAKRPAVTAEETEQARVIFLDLVREARQPEPGSGTNGHGPLSGH